jgi:tRNA pseudouridine-54 N-methylase
MGFTSTPTPPPPPAARPERNIEVEAEDIQLGGMDTLSSPAEGKKALTRPRGGSVQPSSSSSGVKV